MHRIISCAFVGIGLAIPSAVTAGEGCQGAKSATSVVEHIFDQADENQDGSLTQAEYDAAGLQTFGVTFEQSDLDGDGVTSIDEYISLYESHHPTGEEAEV